MKEKAMASPKAQARPAPKGAKKKEKGAQAFRLPFTRINYIGLGVGIAILVIGYICLAQPPVDSFISRTLAPILLVLGYCVVIPIAIFLKEPKSKTAKG
jgi:hypothetical protein